MQFSPPASPAEYGEFTGRGDTVEEALKEALEKVIKAEKIDNPIVTYIVQRISGEKSKERSFIQVDILAKAT
jgi:hypothetical protein